MFRKRGMQLQNEKRTLRSPIDRFCCRRDALLFLILMSIALYVACSPPPPTTLQKCPEPLWKEYTKLTSYQVKGEIARLEKLLMDGDTVIPALNRQTDSTDTIPNNALSAFEIKQRLFELTIHNANPDYDIQKIFDYVSFLYQHGGPDSLRYLNWGRVVREQKALVEKRDSLEATISAISKGERRESRTVRKLREDIKLYLQQHDSLSAVIRTQQETITKLQKLDVLMEQQRSKIQ
jgi:hypothetical protein